MERNFIQRAARPRRAIGTRLSAIAQSRRRKMIAILIILFIFTSSIKQFIE
jgi:glycerol-3-phosphate responsive antiterminator